MNYIKISIITVNLNGAMTLDRTINSVIQQPYKDREYIIVDGGSTDLSHEIIEKYTNHINKIIIGNDKGISDAFNKGISLASGDIIGIISSDDYLTANVLDDIAKCYEDNDHPDVIYGKAGFIENNSTVIVRPDPLDVIWKRQPLKHSSVFVSQKAYEKWGMFDLAYKYAMDYELILRFFVKGARFVYIDRTLSFFSSGGVNQIYLQRTIKEVRDISIQYGMPRFKADLILYLKKTKIFLKNLLITLNLQPIINIYKKRLTRYKH